MPLVWPGGLAWTFTQACVGKSSRVSVTVWLWNGPANSRPSGVLESGRSDHCGTGGLVVLEKLGHIDLYRLVFQANAGAGAMQRSYLRVRQAAMEDAEVVQSAVKPALHASLGHHPADDERVAVVGVGDIGRRGAVRTFTPFIHIA